MSDRQLKGIGVSPGIGVGAAIVVRWTMPEVPHRVVPRSQVEKEVRRLRAAVKDVKRYLQDMRAKAEDRAGVDEARIFDAQILMLEDKEFLSGVADLIRENHLAAEKAYEFKALEVRDMWAATGSPRLKDRLADLSGVAVRVIEHLMHRGSDELGEGISQPSVVVAKELSPGLTVQLDREHVVGLVSEEGTRTSHAAILAHSIGIPAVFGVTGAIDRIEPGTMVVMDGERGTVLLQPTPHEIAEAQARELGRRELGLQLEEVVDQASVTTDGVRIVLRGNVDLPDELERTRALVTDEAAQLAREGIAAATSLPLGVMVETPAAAVMADRLAAEADFLSVGTNDLTQYTLAVDRGNARLAERFTPHDPSVLRLLKMVADAARTAGKPASVCGEMASEPLSAFLLIGLGFETLSVAPPALPYIKWTVRQVSAARARVAAEQALAARTAADVLDLLRLALAEAVDLKLLDPDGRLSGDIALGVDRGGAGDQGMMFGYASDETPSLMPLPIVLAHRFAERLAVVRKAGDLSWLRPDGKTQVSVVYEDMRPVGISKVVVSTQHSDKIDNVELRGGA